MPQELDAGETRLVAGRTTTCPGLTIEPAAPQTRRGILVIAHLGYGFGEARGRMRTTKDKIGE